MDPSLLHLYLPWDQVTHLILSPNLCIRESVIVAILLRCINLVQCRIAAPSGGLEENQPTLIRLEHLEALELMHTRFGRNQILKRLAFPSLKRLIIKSHDGVRIPLDDIATSILGSGCELEVLHDRAYLQTDIALAFINNIPSITDLLVEGIPILAGVLGCIARDHLLPNLRTIECRTYEVFEVTPGKLIESLGDDGFMEPLLDGNVPLSVHIVTNSKWHSIAHLMGSLQRNRLTVIFQQIVGSLYGTECELL
ncbi:hypothetical protein BDZ94DRAFT_1266607 [Collybia nuda]|uniref:Uncharacterized protein n=1 Tax=Collybia nuda TaxID=64659 RepID=A0A9P6CC26_9AGAR|nr:hypothetical protein BDZ94DRAFT_1266607 [Collybia nuda]